MSTLVYAVVALVVMPLVQVLLFARLTRVARVPAKDEQRVARLAAALEMLTDTTEEGFVNVAAELGRLGAKPLEARSSRRSTTRRIGTAVRKGRSIEDIAMAESLSESEVRLHLGLHESAVSAPAEAAPVAEPAAPGVLDNLESWMHASTKNRRVRGGRHAVVRA